LKHRYGQYLFEINEPSPSTIENPIPTSNSFPFNQQSSFPLLSSTQSSGTNSRRKKRPLSFSKHQEEIPKSSVSTVSSIETTPFFYLPHYVYYDQRALFFQYAPMTYIPGFDFASSPQSSTPVHIFSPTSSSTFGVMYNSSYSPFFYRPNWLEHSVNHFCTFPVTNSNTSVHYATPKRQCKRYHHHHHHQQQQQQQQQHYHHPKQQQLLLQLQQHAPKQQQHRPYYQRTSPQRQHNNLRSRSSVCVTHNTEHFLSSPSTSSNFNRISPSSNHSMAFHNFVYRK
jgi:hypothetical protein